MVCSPVLSSQTTLALRRQRGGHVVYLIHSEHASTRHLLVPLFCSSARVRSTPWRGHVPHPPSLISSLPEVQPPKTQIPGLREPLAVDAVAVYLSDSDDPASKAFFVASEEHPASELPSSKD